MQGGTCAPFPRPSVAAALAHGVVVCVASQEIDRLGEDATIYKLTGPILVKQDLEMSKSNVQTRHDFIKKQLYVAGGVWPRCTAGDW